MPNNPLQDSATPPLDSLDDFWLSVVSLIEKIVNKWQGDLIPTAFQPLLKNAWSELKPTIENVPDWNEPSLATVGLASGSHQLNLKLSIVKTLWQNFTNFGVGWLDDLLDGIDDVLDSLNGVPGVDALKELKKAIENLIKIRKREVTG